MSKTKNKTCIYCGLRTEMPVVETGYVSDGKPIKMYKLQCPRCGRGQWTHEDGEHSDKQNTPDSPYSMASTAAKAMAETVETRKREA